MIFNTLLLTAAAMLMRAIGVSFQVYLSNKIGTAGIGLFQLVGSVHALALTVAISGIRFTTTRLVSEELGLQRPGGVHRVLRHCIIYSLTFGAAACLLLYFGAEYIGNVWIGDSRTVLSLRLLSISLPFSAVMSVMGGYFTAVQRVVKTASVQLAENLIRIAAIIVFLSLCPESNLEYACASVVAGGTVGGVAALLMMTVLFVYDKRRLTGRGDKTPRLTRRLFSISAPLSLSTYARSALSTLEHMLVPRGLRKSGAVGDSALNLYGVIHGMVFPVLTFPAALFSSLSELIVPELTENQVAGNTKRIEYLVNRIFSMCIIFSAAVTGMFAFFHQEFGLLLYHDSQAGTYILILSFLMPVIYMDSVTDGMLKGLGQQLHSMAYNVADSLISVVLVYLLLPVYAIKAYIFIIYFTECFNFFLSIGRISKVTQLHLKIKDVLLPFVCILCAVNLTAASLRLAGLPAAATAGSLILHLALSAVVYLLLLWLFSCITKDDIKWFRQLLR